MRKRFIAKKTTKRFKIFGVIFLFTLSFAICLSFFGSLFASGKISRFLTQNTFLTNNREIETDLYDFLLQYTIGENAEYIDNYDGSLSPKEYTADPTPEENKSEPIVYIYNSHQGEEYGGGTLSENDLIPTVMLAAYRLREHLNNENIPTMVETASMSEVLKQNNWNYNQSYKGSRLLIEKALKDYPTITYLIDLHRDAIPYQSSVVTYEGKTYAKVLFVIGRDYYDNLALAETLSNKINAQVPNLSKGIMRRTSSSGGPVFNQDLSKNALLIEVGGQYNSISEVNNTIGILASSLKEVIQSNDQKEN